MTLPWLLMSLLVAAPAPGPVPVQRPMPAPAARPEVMLGKLYDDPKEAITFQPPAGMKQVAVPTVPGAAAEFQDDARKWRLTLTRLQFPAARPLTTPKEGLMVGLLEERTSAWQETPGAEILRSDVYSVGYRTVGHTADTGMIAVRYAAGMADLLGQQAFINVSPSVYYLLELTVPGEHAGAGAEKVSEDERVAAAAFSAMLDTVKLVDRSEVLRDQQERLINTRGLFFASWGRRGCGRRSSRSSGFGS